MRFSKITAFIKKVCSTKSGKKAKASPVDATSIIEVSFQAFGTGSGSDDTIVHPTKLSDGATYEREDTREHIFFNAAASSSVLPSTSRGCADLPAVVEVNDESARRLAIRAGKAVALPDEDEKPVNDQETENNVRAEDVQIELARPVASKVEKARYNTRRTARENEVKFYVQSKKAAQASKKDYQEANNFVFPKRDVLAGEEWPKRNYLKGFPKISHTADKTAAKCRNNPTTSYSEQSPTRDSKYQVRATGAKKPTGPVSKEEAEKMARLFVEDTIKQQTSANQYAARPESNEISAAKPNKKDFIHRMSAKARRAKTTLTKKMVGITQHKDEQMDGSEGIGNQYVVHVEQVVTISEEYVNVQVLPEFELTATTTNKTPEDHTPSTISTKTRDSSTPATSAGTPGCTEEHCGTCGTPKAIVSWQEEMRRSAARKQEEEEYEYQREARATARRVFAQRQKSAATYKWVSEDDEPAIVSWQEELRRSAARKQAEEDYEYRREVSAAAKRVFAQRKKSAATYKWVSDGDEPVYDEPSYEDMGVTMPGIKGRVMVRPRF